MKSARYFHCLIPWRPRLNRKVLPRLVSSGTKPPRAFDRSFVTRKPDEDFPLAWFGLFAEGEEYAFPPGNPTPPKGKWSPSISEAAYRKGVRQVREYIKAGDTYQANFSFRLKNDEASPMPGKPLRAMTSGNGPGYGVFLETDRWAVCSFSSGTVLPA